MPYLFAKQREDYSDLSSGRVLRSLPGHPAFPIRLASEMFQRCLMRRAAEQFSGPCAVYDPCCGTGYLLTCVAFLHQEQINAVIGSDIDAKAVSQADRNLSLLTLAGLDQRMDEIQALIKQYGKESHQAALESARRIRQQVAAQEQAHPITRHSFQADATDGQALAVGLNGRRIDVVLTDIPYGQTSQWRFPAARQTPADPLGSMLEALHPCLAPHAIVAIASAKRQKIGHAAYQRIEHFQVGKRQVVVLRVTSSC